MPKITIQEIARKAGVSTATVSRVLRKQGPISAETEKRVIEAAQALNFPLPTQGWKNSPGEHHPLGMLIAGIDTDLQQNSFFAEVVAGASLEADRRNLSISIAPLPTDQTVQPALVRYGRIDGLIVAGVPIPDEQVEALSQLPIPTVFIGRYLDHHPLCYVSPENLEGGRMAAAHLKELGHCDVVVLSGPPTIKTFNDRLRGAQEALRDCNPNIIISEHFEEEDGYQAVSRLLNEGSRFTAVLALTDWMAFGAIRAMQERGVAIPGDVSVIGFSDLPGARLVDPPLTTIHIPQRILGSLAVHLLHALIEGDISAPIGMMVPLNLAQRASTAPVRSDRRA